MDIKEKLAEIRKRVGDEKAGDISALLSEIQTEFISVDADNKANIRESMARKEKIRAQESDIQDLKANVDKLSDNTKFKELETENLALKTFQKQVQHKTKQTLIDKVKHYEKDESFTKNKDMIGLATKTEPDAEGKDAIVFDIDSMDDNGVNASLGKIYEYEKIGVLGKTDPNGNGNPKDSNPNNQVKVKLDDPNKIDRVKQVNDDPKAYAQWVREGRP